MCNLSCHLSHEEEIILEFHSNRSRWQCFNCPRHITGVNMAASRISINFSTAMSVFNLIFTILALAMLSYKVYYLEEEMSFLRKEISIGKPSNDPSMIQTTPLSTAANSEQHIIERNRRLSQKTSDATSTRKLQEKCLQKILSNIQVCLHSLRFFRGQLMFIYSYI